MSYILLILAAIAAWCEIANPGQAYGLLFVSFFTLMIASVITHELKRRNY